MTISVAQIKELRAATNVSLQTCKKALEEAQGDAEKAVEILRKKGEAKTISRMGRETGAGQIFSYIHSNGKIGVLVDLGCETDFVAKNEAFQRLGKDLTLHVAAMNPMTVKSEDIEDIFIQKERVIWEEELKREKKPKQVWEKIMEGKEKKFREEHALLTQNFVKNPELTIEKLILEVVHQLGENVSVKRFVRYG